MKNRIFVTLLLSIALALPVFAQQTDSNSASQGATATGQPPLKTTRGDFWDGDQPGLAWLVLHPFASKSYVRRHLQAVQDRVNELDEITASNSKMIKDVDSRAQHGIELASTKANEADQHALDAGSKAQMAQQTATTVNTHLATTETVVGGIDQYKAANQTVIHFRPGQNMLSKEAKDALDDMATKLKDQRGYVVEVQGFSSSRGQAGIAASRKMADSVVRYLVLNHEIPAYRIYVVGMGNAPGSSEDGSTAKRSNANRVEVSFLKNDLDQLASTPTQPK